MRNVTTSLSLYHLHFFTSSNNFIMPLHTRNHILCGKFTKCPGIQDAWRPCFPAFKVHQRFCPLDPTLTPPPTPTCPHLGARHLTNEPEMTRSRDPGLRSTRSRDLGTDAASGGLIVPQCYCERVSAEVRKAFNVTATPTLANTKSLNVSTWRDSMPSNMLLSIRRGTE